MRLWTLFNRREKIALVACLIFVMGTLTLLFLERSQLIHIARWMIDPNFQRSKYTGTIVIPDQPTGQCRFTQFDNKTSEIQRSELAECYARPGVNSPHSRIESLRDAFKR